MTSEPGAAARERLAAALPAVREAVRECLLEVGGPAAAGPAIEDLLRMAVRVAAARLADSGPPLVTDPAVPLTQTEAALVCSHLLEGVDLDLFELAMWRNWGRG